MTDVKRDIVSDFFRKEYSKMVSYVDYYINDDFEEDSADVIQDVMTNIFNLADFTVPIDEMSAYVYRSLKNRIIDGARRKKNKKNISLNLQMNDSKTLSLENLIHDTRYDVAEESEKEEIRNILFKAIDKLKDNEKSLIIMTEFEGKTFKEISKEFDIPVGTLLSRKSRALEKIRKYLVKTKKDHFFN